MKITNLIATNDNYLEPGSYLILTLNSAINPPSAKPTDAFVFEVYED